MKKFIGILLTITLVTAFLGGCSSKGSSETNKTDAGISPTAGAELKKIVVGASTTPHAKILEQVKPILAKKGYDLQIVEFVDYVQPNQALSSGDLDANYFQHQPYLDQYNSENGTDLVSVAKIHYEPFGIYPGKTAAIDTLKDGAQIAVPNDATNEARALLLLEAQGLIKLADGAGLNATKNDIVENPKKLDIIEIEAAQLARSLQDVDMAVINGNVAIEGGLNVATDAIAVEDKASVAAETYANIIAVRKGDENREDIKALVKALQSDDIKKFINDTFEGAVVPMN
jgi:D-methionine transport system substrate-binding protein